MVIEKGTRIYEQEINTQKENFYLDWKRIWKTKNREGKELFS